MPMDHLRAIAGFKRDLSHILHQRGAIGNKTMPQTISFPGHAGAFGRASEDDRQIAEGTYRAGCFTVWQEPGMQVVSHRYDTALLALGDGIRNDDVPFVEVDVFP